MLSVYDPAKRRFDASASPQSHHWVSAVAPTEAERETLRGLEGVLGTVAGDDTLLCVAEEELGGEALAARLRDLAGLA